MIHLFLCQACFIINLVAVHANLSWKGVCKGLLLLSFRFLQVTFLFQKKKIDKNLTRKLSKKEQ